jgi:RNA polymerase subunit RPABC4/transcription elongation factor Spt4
MTGFTLPANLNVYISAAVFVIGAFLFALYAGLIVWTVRDVRRRTRDVLALIMAVLLVLVFGVLGLLIYTLLRPQTTLAEEYERSLAEESLLRDLGEKHVCPGCQRRVEGDFVVCPHCHQQLRLRCVGCGRLLNPDWDVCPYCGLLREQEDTQPKRKHRARKAEGGAAVVYAAAKPKAAPRVEAPSAVEAVDEPVDYSLLPDDDEPAGEALRIDSDEVTRRLDEIAADGVTLGELSDPAVSEQEDEQLLEEEQS